MPKQFQFGDDARNQLMAGFDTLAKTVGVTLGPSGRNVILDREFGPPQVCSDGVTIAKEIELKEPFENMGVQLLKQAASKTNDVVGDGTTTSTILAQSMLHEGIKQIVAGANPMSMKRGMDRALEMLRAEVQSMARPIHGKEQVARVAALAAHDEEMGKLIADVLDRVGADGVVTVEESKGLQNETDYVEGMQIDRGFISPYFVTNPDKMVAEVEEPYILLTTEKISSVQELLPLLERVTPRSRNLVVVAENVEGEALAMLVVNKLRGVLRCLAVKAPAFGDRRKAILEDMAVLFGGRVISKEAGRTLESATVQDLGRCRRVVSNKDETTFVEGAGRPEDIKARIQQIKAQVAETTSDYDREKLEERAAKLAGGVAVIKVGAATEVELKEKKQRLEDALSATRAAMQEGVVPGGGTTLVRAAQAMLKKAQADGDDGTGIRLVARACEAPLKLIAENSGASGDVVLQNVKAHEGDWGYDAEAGKFGHLLEMGIMDPLKVTRTALENAVSVASMVLTTESLITELNPKKLPPPYDD